MPHDASKVLLGSTNSSFRVSNPIKGALEAGVRVCLKSDGTPSLAIADGAPIGISLGKDLSDSNFMSYVDAGDEVPILLTAAFTPTIGAQVHVSDTTGKAIASGAGATGINATYKSGVKTGVKEDGTTADCALIHMPGGL